jgi:succinate dehydrogenase / fumarate reductase, cytochrome b subunit
MAVTGLLLTGFLVTHLAGNLTLFADSDGARFTAYAEGLAALGPLVWAAEAGLLALFLLHIGFAAQTVIDNRRARPRRYAVEASRGRKTFASSTMWITGAIVLLFLIVHIWHFRLDSAFRGSPAGVVKSTLASPVAAGIYLVGIAALTLHLSHAIQSALQTFGLNHPRWDSVRRRASLTLALVLGVGFAAFPIYALIAWGDAS